MLLFGFHRSDIDPFSAFVFYIHPINSEKSILKSHSLKVIFPNNFSQHCSLSPSILFSDNSNLEFYYVLY